MEKVTPQEKFALPGFRLAALGTTTRELVPLNL
jgi:hypothetical protein